VHHRFGSVIQNEHVLRGPSAVMAMGRAALEPGRANVRTMSAFTTPAYHDFQAKLLEELLTQYGPVEELWIDAPMLLGPHGRRLLYDKAAELQPDCVIACNNAFGDGSVINMDTTWPTDIVTAELMLPPFRGHKPWFTLATDDREPGPYYVPAEVCESIHGGWFHVEGEPPAADLELLGRRLVCRERGANWLLNVPPDPRGRIPREDADALARLAATVENLRQQPA
jgi:alpha-L-fucosidase